MNVSPHVPTPRPPFVVVEGVDGSGKSSCLPIATATLEDLGWRVVNTREPGGTPLAEMVRTVLLEQGGAMSPVTEALLAMAARRDHVESRIIPALAAGQAVLCDRFTDSTIAYQINQAARFERDALRRAEQLARPGNIVPDLVLLFDLPPEVSMLRLAGTGKTADRFESRGIDYFAAVRAAYRTCVAESEGRMVVIDATQPREAVAEQVASVIRQRIAPPPMPTPATVRRP